MPQSEIRKLAAIVSADVVGYSHLVEKDEAGTIARVNACIEAMVARRVATHNGRIVKLMGDGILIEFSSAIDAVACSLQIQKTMAEREADIDADRKLIFRVGVNLGDIIVIGDDIFGDGVNQAARLQGIAEPGGICISSAVYQQVKSKLEQTFHDIGYHKLKNISEPVHLFSMSPDTSQASDKPVGWPFLIPAMRKEVTAGGCLCGKVRYKVWSEPVTVGFCHCRHCQLALGAPLNAWAIFEKQNVTFEGEDPGIYRSSQLSQRAFCQNCGTSLYTDIGDLGYYSIRVGTLDNPSDFPPELHYGVESQIPWVDLHDDLPRFRTEEDPRMSTRWLSVGEPKSGPTPPVVELRNTKRTKT